MFACSIEIVIYSYNSQKKFPWILQAFDLQGYYFYRVIELIIRTKDHLSRDVVKHMNAIEEQILESLAWESKSALWEVIESGEKVPCYEDTCSPGQLENGIQANMTKKIAPMCTLTFEWHQIGSYFCFFFPRRPAVADGVGFGTISKSHTW